jgi:hypothetical protein
MIARKELERHRWSLLRDACGNADHVATALAKLLDAANPEEAERLYWGVENHVVVQGQIFQAALATVPVLLAALVDPVPRHVRIAALELLYQIVSGQPHHSEIAQGNVSLLNDCREICREGKWLLYRELVHGERDSARDVLEAIEEHRDRIEAFAGDNPDRRSFSGL